MTRAEELVMIRDIAEIREHLRGINGGMAEVKQAETLCRAEVFRRLRKVEVALAVVLAVPFVVVGAYAVLKALGKV